MVPKRLLWYSCVTVFQLSRSNPNPSRYVEKECVRFFQISSSTLHVDKHAQQHKQSTNSTACSQSRNTQRYKITDKSSSSLHVTRGKAVVNNGWSMNNTFNISLNQPFLFSLQLLDRTKKHLASYRNLYSTKGTGTLEITCHYGITVGWVSMLTIQSAFYRAVQLVTISLGCGGRNHYVSVDNNALQPLLDNGSWFLIASGWPRGKHLRSVYMQRQKKERKNTHFCFRTQLASFPLAQSSTSKNFHIQPFKTRRKGRNVDKTACY